jgi:hypothetical protein
MGADCDTVDGGVVEGLVVLGGINSIRLVLAFGRQLLFLS